MLDRIRAGVLGLCVTDAVGVPVEFMTREKLRKTPTVDMCGYGTHHQAAGTWSDDSSMTLCLADSIANRGVIQTYHSTLTDMQV